MCVRSLGLKRTHYRTPPSSPSTLGALCPVGARWTLALFFCLFLFDTYLCLSLSSAINTNRWAVPARWAASPPFVLDLSKFSSRNVFYTYRLASLRWHSDCHALFIMRIWNVIERFFPPIFKGGWCRRRRGDSCTCVGALLDMKFLRKHLKNNDYKKAF